MQHRANGDEKPTPTSIADENHKRITPGVHRILFIGVVGSLNVALRLFLGVCEPVSSQCPTVHLYHRLGPTNINTGGETLV